MPYLFTILPPNLWIRNLRCREFKQCYTKINHLVSSRVKTKSRFPNYKICLHHHAAS